MKWFLSSVLLSVYRKLGIFIIFYNKKFLIGQAFIPGFCTVKHMNVINLASECAGH